MTTDIRDLVDRYFEGDTSSEEEKVLRRYFAGDDLPEDLKPLAPLFRFMEDESAALAVLQEIEREKNAPVRRTPLIWRKLRTIAAVAAVLLAAVVLVTRPGKHPSPINGNYAWVDGKQITDPATVQKYAEISFGKIKSDQDMIEEQLSFMLE